MPPIGILLLAELLPIQDTSDTGTSQGNQSNHTPQGGIALIAGLGDVRGIRNQLVVELSDGGFAFQDIDRHIGGQFILLGGFVGNLGDHIGADPQAIDMDLALAIQAQHHSKSVTTLQQQYSITSHHHAKTANQT